jgi:outer membrane protein, heavy metal efflux system
MSLRNSISILFVLLGALAVPPAARAGTLDSLLARPDLDAGLFERAVLERNPSLAAMTAGWRVAEAVADRARAWDQPMVDIMAAPESFGSSAVDPGYAGSISQRLPISGRKGLQGRVARAGARAAGEDLRAARLDLVRETRRAYYEYYLIGRRQAINAEIQDLMTQFRRIAVGKYSAGTVGLSDALQADVELAMLDHESVALARERRVVTARMNALLLRDPGPLPAPPESIALPAVPARPDSLRAFAIASRPELRSWTEQRRAKEAELSLARRYRLPDVTLTARYDRFMEEREWRGQVGAGLELPIFGGYGGAAREARAGIEQMEQRRRAAEAQIGLELESALAGAQETEHEIHIIRGRVVPATERALAAIRASYENNRADFLALLNAERDLARARLDLHRAEAMYLQNMADLDRALGADPGEVTR